MLSTEDASVIEEIKEQYSGRFNFVYTTDHQRYDASNRESLLSLLQAGRARNDGFTESMIAWRNLFLAVDCDYYVGTLSSNWGRLVLGKPVFRIGLDPNIPTYT